MNAFWSTDFSQVRPLELHFCFSGAKSQQESDGCHVYTYSCPPQDELKWLFVLFKTGSSQRQVLTWRYEESEYFHKMFFLQVLKSFCHSQTCPDKSNCHKEHTHDWADTLDTATSLISRVSDPPSGLFSVSERRRLSFEWIRHLIYMASVPLSWGTEGTERSSFPACRHNDALMHAQTSDRN